MSPSPYCPWSRRYSVSRPWKIAGSRSIIHPPQARPHRGSAGLKYTRRAGHDCSSHPWLFQSSNVVLARAVHMVRGREVVAVRVIGRWLATSGQLGAIRQPLQRQAWRLTQEGESVGVLDSIRRFFSGPALRSPGAQWVSDSRSGWHACEMFRSASVVSG